MERASNQSERERVIVYVDGFNLYFGMIEAGFSYCKWLNLTALAQSLLKPDNFWQMLNTSQAKSAIIRKNRNARELTLKRWKSKGLKFIMASIKRILWSVTDADTFGQGTMRK
jgi:hypothetical protein